ncbi:DUF6279 family lipoprotein [uncultured Microbulbifer sp.]|uniref:DUF6279 family lipoprotein n=1 Tax=uncultured Microbulbifer sp. TaxID=348147 RepID=UPI0025EA7ABC|nr:DUF6279 family lipoprotein [uncultured Microbulbifer sp.]
MSTAITLSKRPSPIAWIRDHIGQRLPWLSLLALLCLTSACSSVRLVYGHLDWWLDHKINNYLDLDGAQEDLLSQRVDEFHRWHRQTQLPRYADFFEEVAGQVDEISGNPKMLEELEQHADALWENSAVMLVDLILPLVLEMDDSQIDQLAENIREEREKSLKKWEKSQRKREKQFRKESERWLGDLTDQQEALIDRQVAAFDFDPKVRDAQRQLWAKTFLGTLRSKPPGYEKTLRELAINPQTLWPPEYQKMHDKLRAQATTLAEEIAGSATPEQLAHLKTTLLKYAADFRILAADTN